MHCCSFTGKRHRGYCHKNHKLWLSIKLEQILEASGDQATIRQQPKKKGEKITLNAIRIMPIGVKPLI